jgi:hypothetical protein
MKRKILSFCLALALVLPAFAVSPMIGEAQAISRYTSTSMSCSAVRSKVNNEGAVILRWTSSQTGNPRYDRFVRSSSYCDPGQRAVPSSVPSASGSCGVKKCQRCDMDDLRLGRFRAFGC